MFMPVKRLGRIKPVRLLAPWLAALQVAAFLTAPAVNLHQGGASATATWEPAHGRDCVPVHRPDACALCRLASARLGPAPATWMLSAGPMAVVFAATTPSAPAPTPPARHRFSRGPPTLA